MNEETEIKGVCKVILIILIGLVFIGITASRARVHFDKTATNALTRDAIISQVGRWLNNRMIQKYESEDEYMRRIKAQVEKGHPWYSRCTIGLIDVRGFGGRVVAGVEVIDPVGRRTRYFTLDWVSEEKAWKCGFYSEGDSVAIHPEEDGYGFIGRFFHRARLEGATDYQE